jgi:hypothetical protein
MNNNLYGITGMVLLNESNIIISLSKEKVT